MSSAPVTDQNIGFQSSFLLPKYWGTWVLIGFISVAALLPRWLSIRIGDGIGGLFRRLNSKREKIVKTNLAMCFPELSSAEKDKLCRDHFRFYGRSVIDLGLTWWAPVRRLEKLITFKNEQQYLDTVKHSNVILLLPHMTAMDCAAGYSAILHPKITMMKAQANALINWRMWKGRTRVGTVRVIMRNQGLRPLIRATKNGVTCVYMPDQDFGESKLTVFAPFFKQQVSSLTTLASMAKMTNAKVMPMYPVMLENGHYEVTFEAPLENFPSESPLGDATQTNQAIEKCISLAPAQYMWTLKWFQTRPDGEPAPYE